MTIRMPAAPLQKHSGCDASLVGKPTAHDDVRRLRWLDWSPTHLVRLRLYVRAGM